MPEFTLDAAPEISETDGKFVVNIPDTIAKPAEEFNKVNSQLLTINSKLTDYEKQLKAFGDNTPESFAEMKNKLSSLQTKMMEAEISQLRAQLLVPQNEAHDDSTEKNLEENYGCHPQKFFLP